jgi:hypothetical protein
MKGCWIILKVRIMMRDRESEEQERMRKMGGFKGNY